MDAAALDPRLRDPDATDHAGDARAADNADGASYPQSSPIAHNLLQVAAASLSPGTASASLSTPAAHGGAADTPHNDGQHTGGDEGDYDDPDASSLAPGAPGDPKKPRACEACRGLKVRCDPDPANPEGACKRCAKAGRSCVVTQPTRKRQKKTDSRVAELEKKIDALTASLQATRGGPPAGLANTEVRNTAAAAVQSLHNALSGGYGTQSMARDETPVATDYQSRLSVGSANARDWASPPVRDHPAISRTPVTRSPYAAETEKPAFPPPLVMAGQKRKFTETREAPAEDEPRESPPRNHNSFGREYSDIIDRGIITMEKATTLFQRFTDHMLLHLPAVYFSPGTTAAEVRKAKPVLFLTILAASSSESAALQKFIVKEMMQIFAEKVVINGEKSLELVQALLISVIWYWPPENFDELKFYQLVHMAVVMAIDLGLGKPPASSGRSGNPWRHNNPLKKAVAIDPCSMESRRTWLLCYYLASNTAMALHRPWLLRWTAFMSECLESLQDFPEAGQADVMLCHMVWQHKLGEEIGTAFSMDDPMAMVSLSNQRTHYALRGFEREMEKYRGAVPKDQLSSFMRLGFDVVTLYMHEVALQSVGAYEEIKPPYDARAIRENLGKAEVLTSAHIGALSACLTAIDGIYDTFLSMDIASIRCLPVFTFVRVAYATVVLIKMFFTASAPNSELGKVINRDNMKVEAHLEALLDKFRATAADDKCRPASKFLIVLVMLRSWLHKQGPNGGAEASSGQTAAQSSQQQGNYSATANTPLQLLSELATNKGAANGASGNGAPVGPAPWFVKSGGHGTHVNHAQPFMYDSPAAMSALSGSTPSSDMTAANGMAMPPPDQQQQQQQQAQQPGGGAFNPWLDAMGGLGFATNEFDYASLGDGFAQAMDMTLAGLTEGSDLIMGFPDLQYIMPNAEHQQQQQQYGEHPGANGNSAAGTEVGAQSLTY